MKIYNVYYLAPNSQTDEYSLLFSGMLLCRLTAPLCLNYLCLIHRDSHIIKQQSTLETSFTTIMGHLDLIPIVNNGLNVFLPFCISAICSAIYFNFGTHILHKLGFEQYIENDEMTIDWVQTGRELVKREKGKLLRNFESSTSAYREMVSGVTIEPNNGRAQTQHPTSNTVADKSNSANQGSPTSLTSSSSGFSRSSLLPRDQKKSGAPMGGSIAYSGQQSDRPVSNRLEDNIVEIDLQGSQDAGPKKPTGFFDDV